VERVEVYLGLGSNQGNRDSNLLQAVNRLDEAFGTHPERISRIVETPAWGFEGPDFLNMCLLYRLPVKGTPEEQASALLHTIKQIEKDLGRDPNEPLFDENGRRQYHDRIIDIDILYFGNEHIQTEELTIPHPLIGERDFVKKPLKEISKPALRTAFPEIFG
jgi:2-amino-4-hydroxy-6-hydroxymethyldihydropteridine diphosphokinase